MTRTEEELGAELAALWKAVSKLAATLMWRTGQNVDVPVPQVVEEEAVVEVGLSGTPRVVAIVEADLKGEKLEIVATGDIDLKGQKSDRDVRRGHFWSQKMHRSVTTRNSFAGHVPPM